MEEKAVAVEVHFFKGGRFVGAALKEFSGTEAQLEEAFGKGKINEDVLEYMADIAKVRTFDNYSVDFATKTDDEATEASDEAAE